MVKFLEKTKKSDERRNLIKNLKSSHKKYKA